MEEGSLDKQTSRPQDPPGAPEKGGEEAALKVPTREGRSVSFGDEVEGKETTSTPWSPPGIGGPEPTQEDFNVIQLDVGGKSFHTTKGVVETILGGADALTRHTLDNGTVFIDRDPKYFRPLINFIRSGRSSAFVDPRVNVQAVLAEAIHWGLLDFKSCIHAEEQQSMSTFPRGRSASVYSAVDRYRKSVLSVGGHDLTLSDAISESGESVVSIEADEEPDMNRQDVVSLVSSGEQVQLRGAALPKVNLSKLMLQDACFDHANLRGTVFDGCNLNNASMRSCAIARASFQQTTATRLNLELAEARKCSFQSTNLSKSTFVRAQLNASCFTSSDLSYSNFQSADMTEVDLTAADLTACNLSGAKLAGVTFADNALVAVNFTSTQLDEGVDFSKKNFGSATFLGAWMHKAMLEECVFAGANLSGVQLQHSKLGGISISSTAMVSADLSYASIDKSTLTKVNFTGTRIDATTIAHSTITDCDFTDTIGRELSLDKSKLVGCVIKDASWEGLTAHQTEVNSTSFANSNLSQSSFFRATVSNCTLEDVTLNSTDFTEANLEGTKFCRVSLKHNKLQRSYLAHTYFVECDFSHADLSEADLTGAVLDRCNLHSTSLSSCKLETVKLIDCEMQGTVIDNATTTSLSMESCNLQTVSIEGCSFQRCAIRNCNIRGKTLTGTSFEDADLSGSCFAMATLKRVTFDNCNLSECDVSKALLDDASLKGANAVNSIWTSAVLYGANLQCSDFTDSDFTKAVLCGVDLTNAVVEGARFEGANLQGANLEGCKLSKRMAGANLSGCDLQHRDLSDYDFGGATLEVCSMQHCVLNNTNLTDSHLQGADLRDSSVETASFDGANLKDTNLSGCTVPHSSISPWSHTKFRGLTLTGFDYHHDFDERGILYYLSTEGLTQPFTNPSLSEKLHIGISSIGIGSSEPHVFLSYNQSDEALYTFNTPGAWLAVDLGPDLSASVSAYTLAHPTSDKGRNYIRNWHLEGSESGEEDSWEVISAHEEDSNIDEDQLTHTWKVTPTSRCFRYFRIVLSDTVPNAEGLFLLFCSGFEIYGELSIAK